MRSFVAAAMVAVLTVTMPGVPAIAKPSTYRAPTPQQDWVTPSHRVPPKLATRVATPGDQPVAPPVWPTAGVFTTDLPRAPELRGEAEQAVAVAGTPVTLNAAFAGPSRVRVEVFDRARTTAAGVKGVLLAVQRADGATTPGRVTVRLDYRAFAGAYGADWALRLRLVKVPACALSTPERPECRRTPLPGINNAATGTLSAAVDVGGGGALIAAEGDTGSGSGEYAATGLKPSATWTAGTSTGEFNWNYGLRTPPAVGGPSPKLAVSYSSASVDGQMAASNNQPSWLGEGFDLWPGYIERRYKNCGDDMGNGGNNTEKTADLCWGTANATLSLADHAGELIADPTIANRWHLRADDGTYVQRRTSAGNGDDDGEWWVVTTTDGTQYWFGGRASSNATLTVPVAGNHANEPGHEATFAGSFRTQAWRWNLDHVVDQHGNTMSYQYAKETNKYAKLGLTAQPVDYDRSAHLTRIEYGTRTGSSGAAPMVVDFLAADRCFTSSCGTHDKHNWKDVPWDLNCTGSPCYVISPTFWSTRRLASVTTKLWTGTGTDYSPVTTWAFTHSTPDPGDGTRGGLRLDRISQTGHVGGATTVPDVTLTYVQLKNRVDPHLTPDHSPPMNWFRLAQITSESGGRIEVTYSAEDCVANTRMPNVNALDTNTLRCYPVKWTPPGYQNPIWDFFHKYVVTEVHEVDSVTPGEPTKVVTYEYVGDPAWHYTDDDGLIKPESKTWSVWRGYGAVRTRTGVGPSQTLSEVRYFRGMHGDKTLSGTRDITMAAVDMNADGDTSDPVDVPAMKDDDPFAGMVREQIVFNGVNGPELSGEVQVPWKSEPTATRNVNSTVVHARLVGVAGEYQRLIRDDGRAPRVTGATTVFDSFGLAAEFDDAGDLSVSGDEKCTLTEYARNTDTSGTGEWLASLVKRKRQYAVGCTRAKQPGLTRDDVIVDEVTYYDSATDPNTPPTRGLLTRQDEMIDWVGGAPAYITSSTAQYDANGRATIATDVKGNVSTTTYTHNAGGQLIRSESANQFNWVSSTTIEPAFGESLSQTDVNGRITSVDYDGLGRKISLWLPGRDKGVQPANETYAYHVRNNAPTVVVTNKLLPNGGYLTTYELLDGLLRSRQAQSPRGDGTAGVQVTDTFYDPAGREWKKYAPYLVAGAPGLTLIEPNEEGDVGSRTELTYDGAGREVTSVRYVRNALGVSVEHSRKVTAYGGDRIDVTQPQGGTATSTFSDHHGNTTAFWQYRGATPTPFTPGSYDATTYRYSAKDQLIEVADPANNLWTYKYDVRGQREEINDPDTGRTTMAYNEFGELESTTDPRGNTLVYTYDWLSRRTALYLGTVAPANLRAEWKYDELLNSRGQRTRSIRRVGANEYISQVLGFTATYQPSGMRFSIPASETGLAGTYDYFYTYKPDGSPETVQLPDIDGGAGMSGEVIRTEYSGLGQPVQLKTSLDGNSTYVAATGYTGYGELATTTLQNNGGSTVTLASYFEEGTRLLNRTLTSRQTTPTNVLDVNYSYDPAGNIKRMSEVVNGDHQCFTYDYLNRLKEAWTPTNGNCNPAPTTGALGGPAKYWTAWEFDADGNRSKQTERVTANGVRTTTYQHPDEPHRLKSFTVEDTTGSTTKTVTYETGGYVKTRPNGAATQTIQWDEEGHAARVDTTEYVYDAEGTRILRRDPTGKTLYLPGQELRYTTASGFKKCTRYLSYGATTVAMRTTGGVTWLAGDHHGTIGATITATTQAFAIRRMDPYGNSRTGAGTWPTSLDKGFVGGTQDNTGLTHLDAREYDPATGRFVSPDPLVDPFNRAHLDAYGYGYHNPIGRSDPSGETPGELIGTKVDWVHLGYRAVTTFAGGYKIVVRLDFYAACRNSGAECVFNWTINGMGHTVWINPALAWEWMKRGANIRLKIYADMSITATRVYKDANVRLPQKPIVLQPPKIQKGAYCLPKGELPEEPHCDFFGPCDDFNTWWKDNKNWLLGGMTVVGIGLCLSPLILACGIAADAVLGATVAGRAVDLGIYYEENGTNLNNDKAAVFRTLAGIGVDIASARLPGVREEITNKLNPAGIMVQAGWNSYAFPGSPGNDIVDPFKYTMITW